MEPGIETYLRPTSIIDSENVVVKQKARELTENLDDTADKARALFYFVRDKIKYNPYVPKHLPEHFRASNTLTREEGYCVQKSALLVALARAIGVPARPAFAEIRNHIVPEKLKRWFGGDVFPWHGYAELYIDGRWVKVTPVFDLKMCQKNRLVPVEFDGRNDAPFPSHNLDGKPHIDYLLQRGHYEDVPVDEIRKATIEIFGVENPSPPKR